MASSSSSPRILIIGYGNMDRQDDGIAWHVLAGLWQSLGRGDPPEPDQGFHSELDLPPPHFLFDLQLAPEMAEQIAVYDRVLFVDAHTGQVPEEINIVQVQGDYQTSPFTHHMTPSTCLSLCKTLYGKQPQAILISIRGYEFGFHQGLSERSSALVKRSIEIILEWLTGKSELLPG